MYKNLMGWEIALFVRRREHRVMKLIFGGHDYV